MSFVGLFLDSSSECSGAVVFHIDSIAQFHSCRFLLFSLAVKRGAKSLQLVILGTWDDQSKRRFSQIFESPGCS
jgi:hypothetical protein